MKNKFVVTDLLSLGYKVCWAELKVRQLTSHLEQINSELKAVASYSCD